MNLKDKLRRFAAEKKDFVPDISHSVDVRDSLGGYEVNNVYGCFHQVERVYTLDHYHGGHSLGSVLSMDPKTMVFLAKDQSLRDLDLKECLFIDTETTGLAGGAGTYAFLVGTGHFVKNHFVVRQYLMRDYPEELPLLAALQDDIAQAKGLISFNGKRFDWPLLLDRFTMNRFPRHISDYLHLDLLFPARRLWKDRLPSCSLSSLEQNILGVHRVGDIPGSEVPQRFFQFLQTGDGELLKDILEHNVIDIVSMVSLLMKLAQIGSQPPAGCDCPFEAEGLGRLYQQTGDFSQAILYYQSALEHCQDIRLRSRLLTGIASGNKRLRQYKEAESAWLALTQYEDVRAYEELAKYYEHHKKDITAAITMARRGLAISLHRKSPGVLAFQHRLARLERTLVKHQEEGSQLGIS